MLLSLTFTYHVFAQIRQSDPQPIAVSSGSGRGGQVCSTGVIISTAGDMTLIWRPSSGLVRSSIRPFNACVSPAAAELPLSKGTEKVITIQDEESRLYLSAEPRCNLFDDWPDNGQGSPSADDRQTQSENSNKPGTITDNQTGPTDSAADRAPKRVLGIIPNYRTSPSLKDFKPLTPKEKFTMAREDSLDRGAFIVSALLAGHAQLTKATPSFGQGVPGYARYFASSYGDYVIGNFMTEAIFPTILRQDPRYFRRGSGSVPSRLGHAVGQIFWTRIDSGRTQFNFSEIVGNATAVAISNAYYPDNRDARDAISKLGIQVGIDMVGNILKEFSPELNRAFARKHQAKEAAK